MKTDTVVRKEGMQALNEKLGLVDAQRFIFLTNSEKFDYTKWQENLFEDMTLEELFQAASDSWEKEEARGR